MSNIYRQWFFKLGSWWRLASWCENFPTTSKFIEKLKRTRERFNAIETRQKASFSPWVQAQKYFECTVVWDWVFTLTT